MKPLNPHTAGDFQGVSIDVAREGGGEQQDTTGRFFYRAGAAQGDHHFDHVVHMPWYAQGDFFAFHGDGLATLFRLGQAGFDIAEGYRVTPNTKSAPLLGHGLGEAHHAHLGGRVVQLANVAMETRRGGDVDDAAGGGGFSGGLFFPGGIPHVRCGGADEAEGSGVVHRQHGFPLFIAHLVQHAVPRVSRIVYENVDVAKRGVGLLKKLIGEFGVRNIAGYSDGGATGLFDGGYDFLRRATVPITDHHTGTVGREKFGRSGSDAPSGSCNNGHLVLEERSHG